MILRSNSFHPNTQIPKRFTGEGADVSPALEWSEVPDGSKSFALLCEDPDAPIRPGKDHPFIHWVIYNIPENVTSLPEGVVQSERVVLPVFVDQGINSFGRVGYGGPMPPVGHGIHRYCFTLYALDLPVGIPAGLTKAKLLKFMGRHILSTAKLIGTYERPAPQLFPVGENVRLIRSGQARP
jgi:Raf kinase inhibitor-like YbhB/YbcL family protein